MVDLLTDFLPAVFPLPRPDIIAKADVRAEAKRTCRTHGVRAEWKLDVVGVSMTEGDN